MFREDIHQSLKHYYGPLPTGVEAIRTAGSTADWRLVAELLIELKAQFL